MHKGITVVGIVMAAGIASGAYTLWRIADQLSSAQPVAEPVTHVQDSGPAAPAAQRAPTPARAASRGERRVPRQPQRARPAVPQHLAAGGHRSAGAVHRPVPGQRAAPITDAGSG